jgi:tetratricopeptide (TPR) repeat protein
VLQGYARLKITAVINRWVPNDKRDLWLREAEEALARVIELRPRSFGAYRLRGALLRAQQKPEQAIEALERALKLNDSFGSAYAERGRTKIEIGRADETIADIETAISLSPTDPAIPGWYLWAGLAAVHLGNHEEGLRWLQKAHEADPAYDRPLLWFAVAEAGLGRWEKARATMAEYRAHHPDFTLAVWNEDYPSTHHPATAAQRKRISALLRELGVPEGEVRTGARQ